MADSSVRPVTSNQNDIYKNLEQVVRKYAATRFLRPIADHTREAFESAKEFVCKFYEQHGESAPDARSPSGAQRNRGEFFALPDSRLRENDNPPECHSEHREESSNSTAAALPVILDSGCGTGESTLHLARKFPDIPVIGIDKSAMRLTKAGNEHQLENVNASMNSATLLASTSNSAGSSLTSATLPDSSVPANAFWVRAELLDFWRLALEEVEAGRWTIPHHAVYYPNPWPKESEATRRFHLHPIFPTLMALGRVTELRTNWEIYAREFAAAARILADVQSQGTPDATNRGDETNCGKPDAVSPRLGSGNLVADAVPPRLSSGAFPAIFCDPFDPLHPETAFERKYKEAHQQLWRVLVKRP